MILEIDDLAQTCFEFLPWLQYRQWILESDALVQTRLIKLRLAMSRQCKRVLQDVIQKDNLQAFRLLLPNVIVSEWPFVVQHATPQMLEFALKNAQNLPSCHVLTLPQTTFENFKLICTLLAPDANLREMLICDILSMERNVQCLEWMLNEKQWRASINFEIEWTSQLWTVLKPSILANRLTFVDQRFLPIEYFQLFPLCEESRKQIFERCMADENWEKAAFLWMPSFTFDEFFKHKIERHSKILGRRIVIWERAVAFHGRYDFCFALRKHLETYIYSFPFFFVQRLFEQSVRSGLPHVARIIWNAFPSAKLLRVLRDCSQKSNFEILEFAYDTLRSASTNDEWQQILNKWRTNASFKDNPVLWKFLLNKQMLLLEDFDWFYVRNHVDFVATAWSKIRNQCIRENAKLLQIAFESKNASLLLFLSNQSEFKFDDDILVHHVDFLSENGLISIFERTKSVPSQNVLILSYLNAHDLETLRALHAKFGVLILTENIDEVIGHHLPADDFLQRFLFFLQNNFFTSKELLDAMPQSPQKEDLMGSIYCDF